MLVAAVAVVASCLALAASASASTGVSSSATNITASGILTMTGGIQCTVSLTLALDSNRIAKVANAQFGGVTGTITGCSGILAGNPNTGIILPGIRVAYNSFAGTLPNISRINVSGIRTGFLLNTIAGSCLYGGTLTGISFNITSGRVTSVTFGGASIPRVSGGGLCPTNGSISGNLTVTGTAPTVTLY